MAKNCKKRKNIKRFLSWLIYKKPNGLYGINFFGYIVLTILIIIGMCIYALAKALI